MPIPNADSAYVPHDKLSEYLLDLDHPVGGAKARWFMSLGYRPENPELLEADLLEIARGDDEVVDEVTRFGVKYVVEGQIRVPNGSRAGIVTVWIVESGLLEPRLVTAYPGKKPNNE